MLKNAKLKVATLFTAAMALFSAGAMAAIDTTGVTTALTAAETDAHTVGTVVIGIVAGLVVISIIIGLVRKL